MLMVMSSMRITFNGHRNLNVSLQDGFDRWIAANPKHLKVTLVERDRRKYKMHGGKVLQDGFSVSDLFSLSGY